MSTVICPVSISGSTAKIAFKGQWTNLHNYWEFSFNKPFPLAPDDYFPSLDEGELIMDDCSDLGCVCTKNDGNMYIHGFRLLEKVDEISS